MNYDVEPDGQDYLKELDKYMNNPIIKFAPIPITIILPNGIRISCNPAMERFTGRKKEEIVNKPIESIYADESKENARKLVEEAVKNDFSAYELLFLRKDGSKIPIVANASSIKTDTGAIIGVIYTCIDITEQKRKEEELTKSRKQYHDLVENVNSIVLRLDHKGVITFLNRYAEELFGYKRDEIIGKNIVGTLVPETENTGRNMREVFLDIIKNPEKYASHVNENITKDGKRLWVSWTNKSIYNEKGNLVQILSIGNDITSQIAMRNKLEDTLTYLESILDHYPDSLVVLDNKNVIKFISPKFEEDFGYDIDTFKGLNVDDLVEKIVTPEDMDVSKIIRKAIKSDGRVTNREIKLMDKNGSQFTGACSGSRLINIQSGKIIGTVLSIRNIEREYKEYLKNVKKYIEVYTSNIK